MEQALLRPWSLFPGSEWVVIKYKHSLPFFNLVIK